MDRNAGIGVFDSGVGGLTVASQISRILPHEKIIYFGDTAHLPYGDKTDEEIKNYVYNIIDFLKYEGVKALIMACNTSSALVLPTLEDQGLPILGVIEFASREALKISTNHRIGVVANPVTVRSGAYEKTIMGFSRNGTIIRQQACPKWVPLVENGIIRGEEVEKQVYEDIKPLLDADVDTIILGCTHYPYLSGTISTVAGRDIRLIDPAEALVNQLKEILITYNITSTENDPEHVFHVSGDPVDFQKKGGLFFGKPLGNVRQATWINRNEKISVKSLPSKVLTCK